MVEAAREQRAEDNAQGQAERKNDSCPLSSRYAARRSDDDVQDDPPCVRVFVAGRVGRSPGPARDNLEDSD